MIGTSGVWSTLTDISHPIVLNYAILNGCMLYLKIFKCSVKYALVKILASKISLICLVFIISSCRLCTILTIVMNCHKDHFTIYEISTKRKCWLQSHNNLHPGEMLIDGSLTWNGTFCDQNSWNSIFMNYSWIKFKNCW